MQVPTFELPDSRMPQFWRYFLTVITILKASIAGSGLALAALGGLDVAFAISAQELLNSIQLEEYLNQFAIGGGIAGALVQVGFIIISR